MSLFYIQHSLNALNKKKGLPPGSPVYTGKEKHDEVNMNCISYDSDGVDEKELDNRSVFEDYIKEKKVGWFNITGLNNEDVYKHLATSFDIHSLVIEDIVNIYHRPKVEEFDKYLFVTLKMIHYDKVLDKIDLEQVSLILSLNFLVSFQEKEGDIFDPIRQRIKQSKGQIRIKKADYLLFCLIDIIIDNYFSVIEYVGNRIDELEENVLENPPKTFLTDVQDLKKQLVLLRKAVFPLREVIHFIEKGESKHVKKTSLKYFRDAYDTTLSLIDSIDTYRDMLGSLKDIYASGLSNKMNNIMKVLTIISSVFIPLTFIAGIYGMNFKYMPELEQPNAYFVVLGVMGLISIWSVYYFKKKEWL